MPETYDSNPRTKSKYDGEPVLQKKYAELGRRITDNVGHKLKGLKTTGCCAEHEAAQVVHL